MALSQRKRLFCTSCRKVCWANHVKRFDYQCKECGSAVNLFDAKRIEKSKKAAKSRMKSKELGFFKSEADEKNRKREGRRGAADLDYIMWIKSLPCAACGARPPVDAHHAVRKSQGGHDRTCVPLCHDCHIGGLHSIGETTFCEKYGLDFHELVRKLNSVYQRLHPDLEHPCVDDLLKPQRWRPLSP